MSTTYLKDTLLFSSPNILIVLYLTSGLVRLSNGILFVLEGVTPSFVVAKFIFVFPTPKTESGPPPYEYNVEEIEVKALFKFKPESFQSFKSLLV